MNLKNLHKVQLKAAIYKLLACPGSLCDDDVFEVLTEIINEYQGENIDA